MFYFGLRIGEIVALKDVDIEQYHIEINRMERRKFKTLNGAEYEQKVRVEKYCRQAGISYKSPHKIPKTYISKLIDDDVNINTIRELVGHVDERTTYKIRKK